jgi:hypothetical protein
LQSPIAQLAALFNAPAQQFAYALNALIEKGGAGGEDGAGGPGVHAGVPETPGGAPEATADAEPPAP